MCIGRETHRTLGVLQQYREIRSSDAPTIK
jgi:hypothetical protein